MTLTRVTLQMTTILYLGQGAETMKTDVCANVTHEKNLSKIHVRNAVKYGLMTEAE